MKKNNWRTSGLSIALLCIVAFGCSTDRPVTGDETFTIVVIPDTQAMIDFTRQEAEGFAIDSADIYIQQMQHIASEGESNGGDVVFVASVGDVWQHVTSSIDPGHEARGIGSREEVTRWVQPEGTINFEIPKAVEGYQLISDAEIPFGVAPGNHDYDAWWFVAGTQPNARGNYPGHVGGLNNFRGAFGSDTDFFRDKDWYVSGFEGGGSSAQVFTAGGYRFLHLALEMQAGDQVVEWAQGVIDDFPGIPTIISTHDYLNPRGERLFVVMDLASIDPERNNSAEDLWQEFISKTDQIFMVLSGHQPGQAIRIDQNEYGHEVYQLLANFQWRGQSAVDAGQPEGRAAATGDGWFREMIFHTLGANPRVDVRTYSSYYESYSSELDTYAEWYKEAEQPEMTDEQFLAADEFTIELTDFRSRFGLPQDL